MRKTQSLSPVLPHKYLNQYSNLLRKDTQAAQEFFDMWAVWPDRRTKVDTKAMNMLNRLEMPPRQPLKRRI